LMFSACSKKCMSAMSYHLGNLSFSLLGFSEASTNHLYSIKEKSSWFSTSVFTIQVQWGTRKVPCIGNSQESCLDNEIHKRK
jgi:hypothetical protein